MVRLEPTRADGQSQVKYEPRKRADLGYIINQETGQM